MFALLLLLGSSVFASRHPIVKTPLGQLRGYTLTSRSGREFLAFSGVPFAKPPVGRLRFQAPEAASPWQGIKDATTDGPPCKQPDVTGEGLLIGQEDCLYLSVFTHSLTSAFSERTPSYWSTIGNRLHDGALALKVLSSRTQPKTTVSLNGNAPVLVHMHGGGFSIGDESQLGPDFFMDEDIVIVRLNYRLDIFGFLTLESGELPGNQGVKDQVMGLRWVQENIASFGGDPDRVTIIGESAGGACVYSHIISPLSKGLFHQVISQSGTSYAPWAVTPPGYRRSVTENLLRKVGCPTHPEVAVPCISAMDAEEIFNKAGNLPQEGIPPFGPVIEAPGPNSFIDGLPSEWEHSSVPLFIGTDSEEGLLRTARYASKDFDFQSLASNFNKQAPFLLGYIATASNPDRITEEVRKFYLNKKEFTIDDFTNLTRIFSDIFFTVPIIDGAIRHSKNNVYFYYFDKKVPIQGVDEKFITGAGHTAEVRYIWNLTSINRPLSDEKDIELSKKLVKTWASFIKTGVPVIEGNNLSWKTWTPDDWNYIQIDTNGFHPKKNLAQDRYTFWKSINYMDKYQNIL